MSERKDSGAKSRISKQCNYLAAEVTKTLICTYPSALTNPTTTEAPQPLCMVTNKQQADLPTNPQFC